MAEQYDNTNSFAMFKNEKGDNEARPDYTGTVTLEGGKEMRMAAWIRESKSGVKFLSGRFLNHKCNLHRLLAMLVLREMTYHSNTRGLEQL